MTTSDILIARLREAFSPEHLEVRDESHMHEGHAHGPRQDSGGGTHFRIDIEAAAFAGRSRIERHRLIHAALESGFRGGMHALAIRARAPGEAMAG
ncbi:MAG: BolA family transcriptional regulator [Alphaproteobacteria bacterium]|nr:BolA family transcriptional regulator [Alphaproteobacteria bacterium]